jgi:hypothetical protein
VEHLPHLRPRRPAGRVAGKYLADNFKDAKIAVIHDKTPYGQGLADETKKALNGAGVTEAMYEGINVGDKDFSALIAKMKEAGVSVCRSRRSSSPTVRKSPSASSAPPTSSGIKKTVAIWARGGQILAAPLQGRRVLSGRPRPASARDMGPIESYLSIDEVIRVAKLSGADAIHPGYGLLSESPEFAEACAAAGITFIGPKPETMRELGNKVAARNLAIEVGVPVVPATDPLPDDMAAMKKLAPRSAIP